MSEQLQNWYHLYQVFGYRKIIEILVLRGIQQPEAEKIAEACYLHMRASVSR